MITLPDCKNITNTKYKEKSYEQKYLVKLS